MDENKSALIEIGDAVTRILAEKLEIPSEDVLYTISVILKSKIGKGAIRHALVDGKLANEEESDVVYEVLKRIVNAMED